LLSSRQADGYVIVGCAFVIAAIFSISIRYIFNKAHEDFDDWDKETCTPGDFTVEMDISSMMVAKYRGAKHLNPSTPSLDQKIKTMLGEELNRDGFYVLKRHMNLKV
tara:strand:+ start:232 stop:552 length:321 start_codon:yes stop_codon:yes gene_type:complete